MNALVMINFQGSSSKLGMENNFFKYLVISSEKIEMFN